MGMKITPEMMAEDERRWYARDVIAELGYCGNYMRDRKDMTNLDIRSYAYIMRKALSLLKEQEVRVLSEEEVRERLGTFLWVEICSPQADWSMCLVFGKVYEDPAYPDLVTIREDSGVAWGRRWEDYGAGCWHGIRSGWRCWSARPPLEQMRNTRWEARG